MSEAAEEPIVGIIWEIRHQLRLNDWKAVGDELGLEKPELIKSIVNDRSAAPDWLETKLRAFCKTRGVRITAKVDPDLGDADFGSLGVSGLAAQAALAYCGSYVFILLDEEDRIVVAACDIEQQGAGAVGTVSRDVGGHRKTFVGPAFKMGRDLYLLGRRRNEDRLRLAIFRDYGEPGARTSEAHDGAESPAGVYGGVYASVAENLSRCASRCCLVRVESKAKAESLSGEITAEYMRRIFPDAVRHLEDGGNGIFLAESGV